jgi:hypothetical protein
MRGVIAMGGILVLCGGIVFAGEKSGEEPSTEYARPYLSLPQTNPLRFELPFGRLGRKRAVRLPGPDTCLTMRSTIVAKKADSDETRVVGQRTCTPSSRFRVKEIEREKK